MDDKVTPVLGPAEFAGTWGLQRRIDDALTGGTVTVAGTASLIPEGDGFAWTEAGRMTLPSGMTSQVSRRYLWRFEGGRVVVRFDDGRAFHSFLPSGESEGTDHPCGADVYRVTYDFRDWPRWRAVWRVTGPRKDYVSDTLFTPLQSRPEDLPPAPSR